VFLTTSNARALGFSASVSLDTTLILSNAVSFEYSGQPSQTAYDFMDVAAHELDEALGIGSALTGLQNNAPVPKDFYFAEDYFRYSASATRDITTNPSAVVYFSYNNGKTNVAQFNQEYSAAGDTNLDRNDWSYGDSGCPAKSPGPYIQDAIGCPGVAIPVAQAGSPEVIVLNTLGYDSGASLTPQTIAFSLSGFFTFGGAPFSISATDTSGLPVSFASTTPAVCMVSGSTVSVTGAGACTIVASQPGNASYAPAAPVTQSFTVLPASQQIAFAPLPGVVYGMAPFALVATATSGLPVAFASTMASGCTVSGSIVTITSAGNCTIVASQPGNANYLAAATVTQSFTVSPAMQTLTFPQPANVGLGTAPFTLSATASSGLAVSFASTTTSVCTVSQATATILAIGTCSITASQPGNVNYTAAAPVTRSFSVGLAQTIAFASLTGVTSASPPFSLTATASSGLAVTFTAAPSAVCTVSGTIVTITGGGVCSITAAQAGNSTYGPAALTQSFTVSASPGGPTILPGGIVPIYSTSTTIQSGSWISIFGSNLAAAPATWNNDFPLKLGGASVTIDNQPAYLWYVSPTQINLQVPTDPAIGNVYVTVTTAEGSWTSTVALASVSPSFSVLDGKHVAGIILRFDGSGASGGGTYDILGPTGTSLGYPTVAATAGDSVVLFGVGFGPTIPSIQAGQLYSGAADTVDPVTLTIGNTSVMPSFSGLSSAGLYQLNLTIPAGLGTGDRALTASVGGVQTQSGVLISLQ
jgi:uncharacterized protein (TIGR03437 family)